MAFLASSAPGFSKSGRSGCQAPIGIMTGSHSIRVVNDRQRRKTVDPYSHGVVGAGAGVHTLDALAAGDQIPVADVVVIHMLAAPAGASHAPRASDFCGTAVGV